MQPSDAAGSAAVTARQAATPAPLPSAETARTAGRGGLAIAFAKISFIFFGLLQQLLLPQKWLLGTDGYGEISRVLGWVSVINNVVVAMAIQGVSRAVSQAAPGDEARVFRRTLRVHLFVALALSAAFSLLAAPLATFASAAHVIPPLRVAALVVLAYGAYAPLIGSLNGRRRFVEQAGFDIVYGAARTLLMLGGAFLFLRLGQSGVMGAAAGFLTAAVLIVPFALARAGTGEAGGNAPELRHYLKFLFQLAIGQICLNLLMQTDLFLLSRFAGQEASGLGLSVKAADSLVGVYRGAQLFAFLPYQMLMAVTFVLFPMLAKASAEGDREAVKGYTMTGVRLSLILTGLLCGTVSAIAPHGLHLVFPEEIWSQGGTALRILALGMGAFSILGVACAALASLGRARDAAFLTAVGVVLVAVGCTVLVPRAAFGPGMLVQTALATSMGLTVTAIAGGLLVSRVAGGFVMPATLVRVLVALAITVAVGPRIPWLGKIAVIPEAALLAGLFVGVLVALGELGKPDLLRIKQVLGRGKKA